MGAGEVHVILYAQGKVLPQGDDLGLNAKKGGPGLVAAVGDIRVGDGLARSGEGTEGKGQDLVRAVAAHHVFRLQAVKLGNGVLQHLAGGVGVEVQQPHLRGIDDFQHLGRGREGAFVGVELDVLLVTGLLAGGIGLQGKGLGRKKLTHIQFSFLVRTDWA